MSISVRILAALLLSAPAFTCFADAAASPSAQSPTALQNLALSQYQYALIDPAYPVIDQMQQSRLEFERMLKQDKSGDALTGEKLARFGQWQAMLQADIQGQRKAGITLRNQFLAGTDPAEIRTRLASFRCADAVALREGSFAANLSAQQTVWIELQSDAKQTVQVNTIGSNVDTKIAVYDDRCPAANQSPDELRDDDLGLAARYELPPGRVNRKFLAVSANQAGDVQIRIALANGSIRGKVTTSIGTAFNGNVIAGHYENGYFSSNGFAYIQNDGTYSISVPPNSYYVVAQSYYSNNFIGQIYPAVSCFAPIGGNYCALNGATLLSVTDGVVLNNIDFSLMEGGSISGRITGQRPGETPSINVYFSDGANSGLQVDMDSVGRFRVAGLPATSVKVSAGAAGAQTQLFDGVDCPLSGCDLSLGAAISVALGVEHRNINFDLEKLPTISGTIIGSPNYSIAIAYDSSGARQTFQSDSTGKYTLSLHPGAYYLSFYSPGFVSQLYANKPCSAQPYQNTCSNFATGTPVILQAQQNVVIDVSLIQRGSISGQVLDDLGVPVVDASVRVCTSNPSNCSSNSGTSQVQTNLSGNYSISGLSAGGYYVVASSNLHLDKAFPNADCQITPGISCNPQFSGASLVSVEDNVQRTGISFSLERAGSISGALSGLPYYYSSSIEVAKLGYIAGIYSQLATLTNNTYKMLDLPPGEYRLIGGRQNDTVFAQIFANRNCAGTLASPCQISSGDPINLDRFSNVIGKDFNFAQRFGASGYVRNANAAPIPNAIVDYWVIQQPPLLPQRYYSTLTDSQGRFSIAVNYSGGDFYLSTDAPNYVSNQVYAGVQCPVGTSAYAGTCSFAGATVLSSPAEIPGQLDNIIFNLSTSGLSDAIFANGLESSN